MTPFKKTRSRATEGRILHRRLRLLGFEYRHDTIARDYMERWTLVLPTGHMIRLHRILRSDDRRHLHDHPFDFVSLILRGGYVEHASGAPVIDAEFERRCPPGTVIYRRAEDLHALELLGSEAWTLVLTGPIRRDWGFQTEDGWIASGEYDDYLRAKDPVPTGATT